MLISVPKRNFKKAVDRNLIRRRIKEAWRKNKTAAERGSFSEATERIELAIIWNDTVIRPYEETDEACKRCD
ncbi:MAG: ribonuclease P protein component [Marinilabiliales bacterium]|nr:ribonuclease P protein component [Marinilabiliales bacterium]